MVVFSVIKPEIIKRLDVTIIAIGINNFSSSIIESEVKEKLVSIYDRISDDSETQQ